MQRLLSTSIYILFVSLITIGCGSSGGSEVEEVAEAEVVAAEEVNEEEVAKPTATPEPTAVPATNTPVILATPTPKPPPPTPTPIPPTDTPEPTATSETVEEESSEPTSTPEPTVPPVRDIMVEIPAGPFMQGDDFGDPEDGPVHEVDLPAFEIDKFEVSNADFSIFAEATGHLTFPEDKGFTSWRDEWTDDNHPVVRVTWNDANAYCEWLGKRLPTESEWEKAARGEDALVFPWGNSFDPANANIKEAGLRGPVAGGSFGAGVSPYGVEDMAGNVWEWTADWYQPYPGNTTEDPYYGEDFRVTRGGGWFDEEPLLTAFNRNAAAPNTTANDDLGFRCAR